MLTKYQQHYRKNAEFYKQRQRDRRARNMAYVQEFKETNPCTDCGQFYPYYVMEFDHLPENGKAFEISRLRTISLDTIKAEIAKCDLVCANCHRVRTWTRIQDGVAEPDQAHGCNP